MPHLGEALLEVDGRRESEIRSRALDAVPAVDPAARAVDETRLDRAALEPADGPSHLEQRMRSPGGDIEGADGPIAERPRDCGRDVAYVYVVADVVVLSLPFTALRDVDYAGAGISPLMDTAIRRPPGPT